MDDWEGRKILSEWFGRSVIRSCCKLTYDHAQQMIDTEASESLVTDQFPDIDGGHSIGKVHSIVKHLYTLSVHLRQKRFHAGALLLNQPKLFYSLDSETGLPNGFGSYMSKDSNRLVEEFMLLANMAVAHRLVRAHPDLALLRRHPAPLPQGMADLSSFCERNEIQLNIESSKSLHQSLERLGELDHPDSQAVYFAMVALCSKPMQHAKYFCVGSIEDESLYEHYALHAPLYTHFTSPIRRYPDLIVHRLLSAALDENIKVKKDAVELQQQADHCNDKKFAAKKVQELSSELFLNIYVHQCGGLQEQGVIVGMLDSAIDVLLLRAGLVKRVYCKALAVDKWELRREKKDEMVLTWKNDSNEKYQSPQKDRNKKQERHSKNGSRSKNGKAAKTAIDDKVQNRVPEEVKAEGPKQILRVFDKVDVMLQSEQREGGGYKTNVFICKPDTC